MKTPRMIGSMNGTRMYHGSMRSYGLMLEFGPNPHKLNILASLSTIRLDARNGQHVVGWMMDTDEALEESELEDAALRNKAIMEGFIKDDDDENHDDIENEELCEVHELPKEMNKDDRDNIREEALPSLTERNFRKMDEEIDGD
ncbi:hypothetical protein Tco_0997753 [Tanacetum coccineum]